MADSEELEGEFISDNLSKDLLKLEKQIIMSPNSHNPSSNCWSMVVIKDNNQESSIVFPPAHHENLQLRPSISTEELQKPHCSSYSPCSSSSSSSYLSSSSSNVSTLSVENEDDSSSITPLSPTGRDDKMVYLVPASRAKDLTRRVFMDWVYFGLELFIKKIKGIILRPSLFTTVLLLGYIYFHQRRLNFHRRRRAALLQESREKDQRISQLLNQITRMNEVMVTLQRNSATTVQK